MKNVEVNDLRSALELLESIPGQFVETDVEVDPNTELSGVYRHVGAGGTVERPTKEGPAMVFNNVKGHEGARVAIGVLSSRKRVGYLLGEDLKNLGFLLKNSVEHPVELVQCLTINERAIANAEYVIEGEILPNVRVREDQNSNTGKAMPEFPGYCGTETRDSGG